jgi:glycosyltransferase involved in cell wall biosynthesis
MLKGIWVTWEVQRRNNGLSAGLGVKLYTIVSSKPRLLRYLESIIKTLQVIHSERPDVVFAQNPSTVLALFLVLIKPLCLKQLILDAHNTGIYLLEKRYRLLNRISAFIQKKADLTLVTCAGLQKEIERNGGRARVICDRIPQIENPRRFKINHGGWKLAFVCSFAFDEPYDAVFACARQLPDDVTIFVTGRYRGKVNPTQIPANVKLVGFLPEEDFWGLLQECHLVLDLTTQDDCLVCGAYEGIAAGKPLILSDTAATKALFRTGCVYVKPTVESIRDGILKSMAYYGDNLKEIRVLKDALEKEWTCTVEALRKETLHS